MDKIPETILKLIWSCQFFFLKELPLSEVDENQGKPTTQVSYHPYFIEFQSADKFVIPINVGGVLVPPSSANGSNIF